MTQTKPVRPAFQAIELDEIDARLEAKAVEKGIPTLVTPKADIAEARAPQPVAPPEIPRATPVRVSRGPAPREATPRSRMKGLKIELPPYAWVELKKRTAEDMVSLRYFVMDALRAKGIHIEEADMVEDGRRFRD
jgi:hypothetical protein